MPSERAGTKLRAQVYARADGYCEYCRSSSRYSPVGFSIEHVLPRSKGGQTVYENLALACQDCNNYKYDKTAALDLRSDTIVPLFNPRTDEWNEHFRFELDTCELIGMSATGRATIVAPQLNRENVVNMRRLLAAIGKFPP